jgi:hypothetical protein
LYQNLSKRGLQRWVNLNLEQIWIIKFRLQLQLIICWENETQSFQKHSMFCLVVLLAYGGLFIGIFWEEVEDIKNSDSMN